MPLPIVMLIALFGVILIVGILLSNPDRTKLRLIGRFTGEEGIKRNAVLTIWSAIWTVLLASETLALSLSSSQSLVPALTYVCIFLLCTTVGLLSRLLQSYRQDAALADTIFGKADYYHCLHFADRASALAISSGICCLIGIAVASGADIHWPKIAWACLLWFLITGAYSLLVRVIFWVLGAIRNVMRSRRARG